MQSNIQNCYKIIEDIAKDTVHGTAVVAELIELFLQCLDIIPAHHGTGALERPAHGFLFGNRYGTCTAISTF